ncbi:MAG: hypothetical protein MAG715_01104 [Methanonatronarchaeales archaeon]|nr:hypothetical protein [Methanonatronarchaeales archaeon]
MDDNIRVSDYMTDDVVIVGLDETVRDVARRMKETGHEGFPAVEDGRLVGYVSARSLVMEDPDEQIFKIMTADLFVAHPDMDLNDAARVMFRSGVSKLPVVNDAGRLVGIITNSDVIRSQIERATPAKVEDLMETLERVHGVEATVDRRQVGVDVLVPTQGRVFRDELEGRKYELKRGLAEPIVVVHKTGRSILVDGHHRAVAAHQEGIEELEAYVIELSSDVELGLEMTAESSGLRSLGDVEILEDDQHPLIRLTKRYRKS